MRSIPPIVDEAERVVRQMADELTEPRPGECLCCYVARQLDNRPCNGSHRLAVHYRDVLAPRATGLLDRLSRIGACCCDCELFLNGYELREDDGQSLPPCAGARRGSTKPCANWVRIGRGFGR